MRRRNGIRPAIGAVAAAVAVWPATAWAWPASEAWFPLTSDSAPMADISDLGADKDHLDFVGSEESSAAWWSANASTVYFRFRLLDDPRLSTESVAGAWGVFIDTDGNDATFEVALGVEAPSDAIYAHRNTTGGSGVRPGGGAFSFISGYGTLASGAVRSVSGVGGNFLDFQVLRTTLAGLDVTDTRSWRVLPYAALSLTAAPLDLVGCGDTMCSELPTLFSDSNAIDADIDGVPAPLEWMAGADANDADSDEDGVLDGEESLFDGDGDGADGIMDCDADSDGILDGTESGVTEVIEAITDVTAGCFVADADISQETDLEQADSDGGGLQDGQEDRNFNGRIDLWETDPNEPGDDIDTDLDGIPDLLEGDFDADGDGRANALDIDADGDGITDTSEGLGDSDEDGTPDFLDDDSDGDGILDIEEGMADPDGDGIPNVLDDDSDGDGRTDAEEGVEDSDCDGILDAVDENDADGNCETDLPGFDTDFADGELLWSGGSFTGGACASVRGSPAWLLGLLGVLALLRRGAVRRGGVVSVLAVGVAVSSGAEAQEIDAQRFRPSVDGSAFVKLEDTALAPKGTFGGGLWFDHAESPFVFRVADGSGEIPVLGRIGTLNAVGFARVGPVRLGLDLPIHAYRTGYDVNHADLASPESAVRRLGAALGDARVSAKWVVFDRVPRSWGLALTADVTAPTGDGEGWVGERQFGGRGGVSFGRGVGAGAFVVATGFASGSGSRFGELRLAPRFTWGAGYSHPITEPVWVSLEIDGENWLSSNGASGASPVEWLGALRYRPVGDWVVTLAGGSGLSQGIGAPDFRGLGSVAFTPAPPKPVRTVGADPDGDGILEGLDRCPTQPEDRNGIRDEDGCPDANGMVATTFEVVNEEGTKLAGARVELVDGPETGAWVAADGVVLRALPAGRYTVRVNAPRYAEVVAETDVPKGSTEHAVRVGLAPPNEVGRLIVRAVGPSGVPVGGAEVRIVGTLGKPLKTSKEGLFEADLIPGGYDVSVSAKGWTSVQRHFSLTPAGTVDLTVYMEPSSIVIDKSSQQIFLKKVFFQLDRAELKIESLQVLDELAASLVDHPEIAKLRVEGHTDAQGSESHNLDLSKARAQAVVDYLVRQGVPKTRLFAQGYGETRRLQQGDSDDVHATNRRCEFHIQAWK